MISRRAKSLAVLFVTTYGLLLGVSAFAGEDVVPAKETAALQKPEPGSPGDTLTREDARMALLVYKLLDKDGKIKGADIKRGEKLYMQNCRACHGGDGHRFNFSRYYEKPAFIGDRARDDMPTFWYQINFGDVERGMEAYIDEFPLQDLIDIAGFAQTLP
ncbi:c-type cytochrome [Fibrobacter sp.]|uniref:c-type cytochrome n=1 Tax=Fibrobacter sp. TaxID=35828 RepID=UPI00386C1AC5